jgi:hypothetical protein
LFKGYFAVNQIWQPIFKVWVSHPQELVSCFANLLQKEKEEVLVGLGVGWNERMKW